MVGPQRVLFSRLNGLGYNEHLRVLNIDTLQQNHMPQKIKNFRVLASN